MNDEQRRRDLNDMAAELRQAAKDLEEGRVEGVGLITTLPGGPGIITSYFAPSAQSATSMLAGLALQTSELVGMFSVVNEASTSTSKPH